MTLVGPAELWLFSDHAHRKRDIGRSITPTLSQKKVLKVLRSMRNQSSDGSDESDESNAGGSDGSDGSSARE